MDGSGLPITVTNLQHLVRSGIHVGRKTILLESVDPSKQTGYKVGMKTPNRAVNNIEENKTQLENTTDVNLVHTSDVNSSYRDSDEDYYNKMTSEGDNSPKNSVDENGYPKYRIVNFGNNKFNIMVETGSVVSLITKRIAQEIESDNTSAWWSCQPNSMKLKISTILRSKI